MFLQTAGAPIWATMLSETLFRNSWSSIIILFTLCFFYSGRRRLFLGEYGHQWKQVILFICLPGECYQTWWNERDLSFSMQTKRAHAKCSASRSHAMFRHLIINVCMHIYMYMYTYMYTFICLYIYAYFYIHIHIYIYIYIYVYVFMYIYIYIFTYLYKYIHI